ncbi:siroheme synthase CysG [Roseitranquillus sediminis]|uniref:siroheme synthase CysG n=1 Tax=Roseitranquillus sediminis TaxID=2809051 RepID=UPI001D0C2FA8|nr:siroheme synthase CysG [Roseitranquillus sediminis]MBM9595818.1 uroporphyrinogen-III C-methyltransferase [Roseitranquillus sediminis]
MQFFPMFLRMAGRDVVIAGGGEQAAQKARLMLKTEARLTLVASDLDEELTLIVASGRARHQAGPIAPRHFAGTALVFVATGCPAADACVHALAKEAGATVNVVDRPELCDATTPSIVDRDPVVVAIGTEGTAPVLGRRIKTEIERMLDPRLGGFAALAGRLRGAVAARVPRESRRAFWLWAFSGPAWQAHRRGAERAAAATLKAAIETGGAGETGGLISLVGAGPGARDLLTLRAVARLQEADVIFYDRLVDPDVLELARRDAERVYVGKAVGACAWPQERINDLIVAQARRGLRVVRLKSGDPSIFGRAGEELDAARRAGVAAEIVPGVTAASAAAASVGRPLTERGVTDRVVLSTGACRPGDPDPDWSAMAAPGTTLALYMAVGKVRELRRNLLAAGHAPETVVEIVENASGPHERHLPSSLARIAETVEAESVRSPAILTLRFPKPAPSRHCARPAVWATRLAAV